MRNRSKLLILFTGLVAVAAATSVAALGASGGRSASPQAKAAASSSSQIAFHMVPSTAAVNAGCLTNAKANVTVTNVGPVENMKVNVSGLPANTEFDLFVIQVPNAPFGMAWYQGDIETNANGNGSGTFVGRFSIETFVVATGTANAPVVHETDASSNPATGPIHTYHLGLWFGSPEAAAAAGCPDTVTPFNGDHNAGVQALSTRNAPDDQGPLRSLVTS